MLLLSFRFLPFLDFLDAPIGRCREGRDASGTSGNGQRPAPIDGASVFCSESFCASGSTVRLIASAKFCSGSASGSASADWTAPKMAV